MHIFQSAVMRESCPVVCLDDTGKMHDSLSFSLYCFNKLESGGARLAFVIGGAEGLPEEFQPHGDRRRFEYFSLSSLTFTHQMARVLLAEQIYRASEIRRGSGYHKD